MLKMLLLQNVWTGDKGVRLSHYTHILKLLSLVLVFFLKMSLLQNVWKGDEGVWLSVYTHILILLLPTFLACRHVLSTLNKIVPSDRSCLSVKFNSLLKNLWHCCKNRNYAGYETVYGQTSRFVAAGLLY